MILLFVKVQLLLFQQIFHGFFYFPVIGVVVATTVGKQGAGKSFGNMHQFMDQGFYFLTVGEFIKLFADYFNNIMGFEAGDFFKKPGHAPDPGVCSGLGVKTTDAIDTFWVDMNKPKFVNEDLDLFFYFRR